MDNIYYVHTVGQGDTFASIAKGCHLSVDELLKFNAVNDNPISDIKNLIVGQTKIFFPKVTMNVIHKVTKASKLIDVISAMHKRDFPVSLTDLLSINWRLREIYDGPNTMIPAGLELFIPQTGDTSVLVDGFSKVFATNYNKDVFPSYRRGVFSYDHSSDKTISLEDIRKKYSGARKDWIKLNQKLFDEYGWDRIISIRKGEKLSIRFPFEASFWKETVVFDRERDHTIWLFKKRGWYMTFPKKTNQPEPPMPAVSTQSETPEIIGSTISQPTEEQTPIASPSRQATEQTTESAEPVVQENKQTNFSELYQNLPNMEGFTYVDPKDFAFESRNMNKVVDQKTLFPWLYKSYDEASLLASDMKKKYGTQVFLELEKTVDRFLPLIVTSFKLENEYTPAYLGVYISKNQYLAEGMDGATMNHKYYFGNIGTHMPGVGIGKFRFSPKHSAYAESAFIKLIEIAKRINEKDKQSEVYVEQRDLYNSHEAVQNLINLFKSSKSRNEFFHAVGSVTYSQLEWAMQEPNGQRIVRYMNNKELSSIYNSVIDVIDYALDKKVIDHHHSDYYLLSMVIFLAKNFGTSFIPSAKKFVDDLSKKNMPLTYDSFRVSMLEPFMKERGYKDIQKTLNSVRNAARLRTADEFIVEDGVIKYVLNYQDVSKRIVFPHYPKYQSYVPSQGRAFLKLKINAMTDKLDISKSFAESIKNDILSGYDKIKKPQRGMTIAVPCIQNKGNTHRVLNNHFTDHFTLDKAGGVTFK